MSLFKCKWKIYQAEEFSRMSLFKMPVVMLTGTVKGVIGEDLKVATWLVQCPGTEEEEGQSASGC